MEGQFVVIAGVGPGIGAAVARKFATKYTVVLLNRDSTKLDSLRKAIQDEGGHALNITCDISNSESVRDAFEEIVTQVGDQCVAAIFNASTRPFPWPFLWQKEQELQAASDVNVYDEIIPIEDVSSLQSSSTGAFLFAQAVLPLMRNARNSADRCPTLIFTGATASVKANAWLQPFAMTKHALRALAGSLAKEFGPEGIHVAHVIVDGVVRMNLTWFIRFFAPKDSKFDPDAVADMYWHLHDQPRTNFSFETTIRPFNEKW